MRHLYRYLYLLLLLLPLPVPAGTLLQVGVVEAPLYMEPGDEGKGMLAEIVREALTPAGYAVRFRFYPMRRVGLAVSTGEVAAALVLPFSLPADMADRYLMAEKPAVRLALALAGLSTRFPAAGLPAKPSELAGLTVGVRNGIVPSHAVFSGAGLSVDSFNSLESGLAKLLAGRTDLMLTDPLLARHALASQGKPADLLRFGPPLLSADIYFAVSRQRPDAARIQADFAAGMRGLVKRGGYQRILEKYYGMGQVPEMALSAGRAW